MDKKSCEYTLIPIKYFSNDLTDGGDDYKWSGGSLK